MKNVAALSGNELRSLLKKAKRIVLSTHLLPDGDGLGAQTALYHYLKKSKKQVRIANPDEVPKRYRFLDPKSQFLRSFQANSIWKEFDLWLIVDTNDPRRVGKTWEVLSHRAEKIVFIDHHEPMKMLDYPQHARLFSDVASSSIGELLLNVFQSLKWTKLDRKMAIGLYVSVMTDTNSFRYARTTPSSHRIAAEMIERGVNPEEIYQAIYSSKEVSHLQLLGRVLQEVQVAANGKIAWLEMSLSVRQAHSATADDTQSFLNLLLLSKDAEVVCFFREEDDNCVRLSMRSKGKIAISQLAMSVGGGGHEFAAGAALPSPLSQAVKQIIEPLEKLIAIYERTHEHKS